MFNFKGPLQINPLGSKDPNNRDLASAYSQVPAAADLGVQNVGPQNSFHFDWDNSPNHPIIQDFQNLFNTASAKDQFDHPDMQNYLFDVDNTVKGTAGVFREPQQGLSHFGSDIDGKPLYAFDDIKNSSEFDLGKNRLYSLGSVMQQLGGFNDEQDSDRFAKITNLSSDANFMGRIEGLQLQGDTKGAVNTILSELGHPSIDDIEGSPDAKRSYGLAFAAYNYAQNAEKFSPSQKSLALSTMGLTAFKYKDGNTLSSKPLIKDEFGNTTFSSGDALALAGSGVDVFSLQKNWDQIDAVQRLTYGQGSASQMASTGKRTGLLGNVALGGASVPQTDAELGQAGFVSIPSAGIGAITGSKDSLPQGYEVVGAGQKPGQVIAVPKGLSYSAATINGSNEIRSLNAADGVRRAGTGAFKVAANWLPMQSKVLNSRGTSFASGLGQSGILEDPYLSSSIAVTSVFGNTTNKYPPPESFDELITKSGTNARQVNYNVREMAKTDENVNTAIKGTQAVVNSMARFGNSSAQSGAPYVNAIAAGKQVYDVMKDPNATDKQKAEAVAAATQAGTNVAASLGSGAAGSAAPGMNVAMAAYNASKIIGSDMSDEEKATALRKTAEDTTAAVYTFGLSAVGQFADQQFLGGRVGKFRDKLDSVDPTKIVEDKIAGKLIGQSTNGLSKVTGAFGGGGKSKAEKARDEGREMFKDIAGDKGGLTLSDGTIADISADGKDGQHEFRFPEKDPNKVGRPLNAYDVDYTNDLDFTANIMTNSLARLVAGGKGTSIDQVAGQMANASLGKVGFAQDMTEDNFAYVRDNIRGWYFKKGIQTKEDAYALMNQQFGTGRITEMDQVAMQQGINMVFDESGFDNANIIMSGRQKGLEVAGEIPKAPGPNFDPHHLAPTTVKPDIDPGHVAPDELEPVDNTSEEAKEKVPAFWNFDAGTYGGNKNTDIFTKSIIKYQDQYQRRAV